MGEYKNYARNSLQTRLERSRRYRSRGTSHPDGVSVGDASVTSVDNVSTTSASIEPSVHSKNETSVNQELAKVTSKNAIPTGEDGISTEVDVLFAAPSSGGKEKHPLRRQRLAQKPYPYKSKRVATPQSPPNAVTRKTLQRAEKKLDEVDERNENKTTGGDEKKMSNDIVAPTRSTEISVPNEKQERKAVVVPIETSVKYVDQEAAPRRNFQSPKHQVASPCESMAYQASIMEEDDTAEQHVVVDPQPPSRKSPATFGANHGPSALQSWKQREQKGHSIAASPEPKPRNRVVVAPKIMHGNDGGMYGSNMTYRHSYAGVNIQTNKMKQMTISTQNMSPLNIVGMQKKANPSISSSPLVVRQAPISSPNYHHRHSAGGNVTSPYHNATSKDRPNDGSMYKNILKPVRRDREESTNPTEKTAFGGVIETPKSVKVSSLLASFDSHQSQPLMPMNSKDPRVRHSLPFHASTSDRKKSVHETTNQAPSEHEDNKFVQTSRQVVAHPPGRFFAPASKPLSAFNLQPPDVETVQSGESTSHSVGSTLAGRSSPLRRGVAERYKTVTGKMNVEQEPERLVDEEDVDSEAKTIDRTQKYYKASWRVQTNDFDDEKNCSESTHIEKGTLSPRQSVLSSWNQRYREQVQATSPSKLSSHEPNFDETCTTSDENQSALDLHPERDQPDSFGSERSNHSEGSEESGSRETESESSAVNRNDETFEEEKAAKKSVFSTWQQREKDHPHLPSGSSGVSNSGASTFHTSEAVNVLQKMISGRRHEISGNFKDIQEIKDGNPAKGPKVGRSEKIDSIPRSCNDPPLPGKEISVVEKRIGASSFQYHIDNGSSSMPETFPKASDLHNDPTFGACDVSSDAKHPKRNDQNAVSHPWNKDTKQSVVQSWQSRSSKVKSAIADAEDANKPRLPPTEPTLETKIERSCSRSGRLPPFNPSDFIDEKKSDDLSVDEDIILGIAEDGDAVPSRQRTDSSINQDNESGLKISSRQLTYDDDSYISDGGSEKLDTVSDEIVAVPSKAASARSNESSTELKQIDSEEISLYVEDDLAKKMKKVTPSQIKVDKSKVEDKSSRKVEKQVINNSPEVDEHPADKQSTMRIHPSPKDSKKYRKGYFGDESPSASRVSQQRKSNAWVTQEKNKIVSPPKASRTSNSSRRSSDPLDIWAVSSVSDDEIDEDIQFDETDEWLARDPEVNDEAIDDSSILSDLIDESDENAKTPSSFYAHDASETLAKNATTKTERPQGNTDIPVLENTNTWTPSKENTRQGQRKKESSHHDNTAAFDPFHDESAEETKEVVPVELFSPNPDPFMTEESFSPLDWSSPRGTTAQHIGYYNSPDSRLEI